MSSNRNKGRSSASGSSLYDFAVKNNIPLSSPTANMTLGRTNTASYSPPHSTPHLESLSSNTRLAYTSTTFDRGFPTTANSTRLGSSGSASFASSFSTHSSLPSQTPPTLSSSASNLSGLLTRATTTTAFQLGAYALHEVGLRANLSMQLGIRSEIPPQLHLPTSAPNVRLPSHGESFLAYANNTNNQVALLRANSTPLLRSATPAYVSEQAALSFAHSGNPTRAAHEFKTEVIQRALLSDTTIRNLKRVGKGMGALTLGLVAYEVNASEDKISELQHQGALLGAGVAGGYGTGLMSLAPCAVFGPAQPLCVLTATIAGGIAGTELMEWTWHGPSIPRFNLSVNMENPPEIIERFDRYERNHKVVPVDPNATKHDYFVSGVRGVVQGIKTTWNAIIHPIDELVLPASRFVADSSVLVANKLNLNSNDSDAYQLASFRMEARIDNVKAFAFTLKEATGPERTEIVFAMGTSFMLPTMAIKGLQIGSNVVRYGKTSLPPTYTVRKWEAAPAPSLLRQATVTEIHNVGKKAQKYVFAIKQDGTLVIAPSLFQEGGALQAIGHSAVANHEPVYAIGSLRAQHGRIIEISNISPFKEYGKPAHLSMVENTFRENGFIEVNASMITNRHNLYTASEILLIPQRNASPLFSVTGWESYTPRSGVIKFSVNSIRPMRNERQLMFVIRENGELILTPTKIKSEGTYIHNSWRDVADGKPVFAAGTVKVKDGKIVYIDNASELATNGRHIKGMVEKAFIERGFTEAESLFQYANNNAQTANHVVIEQGRNLTVFSLPVNVLASAPMIKQNGGRADSNNVHTTTSETCKGITVSPDGRYLNPADEVCPRLAVPSGERETVKISVYNNGLWSAATHGKNAKDLEVSFDTGYFISKQTCEIPEEVLTVCKPADNYKAANNHSTLFAKPSEAPATTSSEVCKKPDDFSMRKLHD